MNHIDEFINKSSKPIVVLNFTKLKSMLRAHLLNVYAWSLKVNVLIIYIKSLVTAGCNFVHVLEV